MCWNLFQFHEMVTRFNVSVVWFRNTRDTIQTQNVVVFKNVFGATTEHPSNRNLGENGAT